MRALAVILVLIGAEPSLAAEVVIHDGASLTLGDARYRLHGIDAPELDQVCLDENGRVWPCGVQARERLKEAIGGRQVHCDDKGPDPGLPHRRRMGECRVLGVETTLHQWLVRQGWALNFEPYAKGLFKADEEQARVSLSGLWRGCFSTPQDFRLGNKGTANFLGASCAVLDDRKKRGLLFPDHPTMAPGCTIKGKFVLRAKITATEEFTTWRGAAAISAQSHQIAGSALKRTLRLPAFAGRCVRRIAKTANWVGQICRATLHRFERTISVEGGADAALAGKLIEIAGKCPVHRTLEAGAAVVTKVAG
jgi:endonuclease YncB( thermonuclease family)